MFAVTHRPRLNILFPQLLVVPGRRSSNRFSQKASSLTNNSPSRQTKVSKGEEGSGEPVIFSDEWLHRGTSRKHHPPNRSDSDEPVLFSDELTTSLRAKTRKYNRSHPTGVGDSAPLSSIVQNQPIQRNLRLRTGIPRQKLPQNQGADLWRKNEAVPPVDQKTSTWHPSQEQLHALTQELERLKASVFKLNGPFRELQLEAMVSASLGRNVLCVVPTGSGKSLIYQLPALVEPMLIPDSHKGVTVVVSPLKALMFDQAKYLQDTVGLGEVGVLNGDLSREIQSETLTKVSSLRYLFVTPETLLSPRVVRTLFKHIPRRFVFDEAHCIVEWGRSFRPKYREVCKMVLETFKGVPWTFLTATAPPDVRACLLDTMGASASDVDIFVSPNASRENLEYRVIRKPPTRKQTLELVRSLLPDSGNTIIFCLTKDECDSVAAELEEATGKDTPVYHAGLSATVRNAVLFKWQMGLTPVIVATNAFGMGMHNAAVRLVLHHSMPMSLFNYIQQCGRAGRDGKPSRCVLLYDERAAKIAYQLTHDSESKNEVDEMISFCKSSTCVRESIHAKLSGTSTSSSPGTCRPGCGCRERL